jgi:hypothetical protein
MRAANLRLGRLPLARPERGRILLVHGDTLKQADCVAKEGKARRLFLALFYQTFLNSLLFLPPTFFSPFSVLFPSATLPAFFTPSWMLTAALAAPLATVAEICFGPHLCFFVFSALPCLPASLILVPLRPIGAHMGFSNPLPLTDRRR